MPLERTLKLCCKFYVDLFGPFPVEVISPEQSPLVSHHSQRFFTNEINADNKCLSENATSLLFVTVTFWTYAEEDSAIFCYKNQHFLKLLLSPTLADIS